MRRKKSPVTFIQVAIVLVLLLSFPALALAKGGGSGADTKALSPRIMCNRATFGVPGGAVPELWTTDYAGGNLSLVKPYAVNPFNAKNPVYAPNGSWIAFEGTDQVPTYKSTAIYISGFDGTNPVQVTPTMDLSQYGFWGNGEPKYSWLFEAPTFSADSSKVYYSATLVRRDSNGNIIYKEANGDPVIYVSDTWRVNVDGTGWGPVRPSYETASEMFPQGSPVDGRIGQTQMMGSLTDYDYHDLRPGYPVIYGVAANAGIFTINADGTNQHKVVGAGYLLNTSSYRFDAITPVACAWSADGTKMAVAYYVTWQERTYGVMSYTYFGISVVDPNTTTDVTVPDLVNANYYYGNRITPVGFPRQGDSIATCDSIGKLSWSPDGRFVLFDVGNILAGKGNVYKVDASDPAHPGAPVAVSTDNISYYPSASPANLGDNVTPVPLKDSPFYLAEGTTRPNFDEYLAIQNPNDQDADVNLNYLLGGGAGATGGSNMTQKVTVPKKSRKTVKVIDTIGANKDVSVQATSTRGVIVERPMYFNYGAERGLNWTGGHDVVGATNPMKIWYFAEGTTRKNAGDGAYEEYLCLENPNATDATATITYMLGTGENKQQKVSIKGNSRNTVNVNDFVGLNQDVSARVESDQPIVAERPIYFNYKNKWNGGHDVIGAASSAKDWYFAEGTTRNNATDGSYDEWLCLQNPNSELAKVTITYMLGTGENKEQKVEVPANSRYTVGVNGFVGPNQDVSCRVSSDKPIVAERPIYFRNTDGWDGGHDVIGALSAKTSWYFAEGTTRANFKEWLCLQNPGDKDANVTLTYMLGSGENKEKKIVVKAKSRYTVNVASDVGPDQDVSTRVSSDNGIIAERPMYFNYNGVWNGGHDVVGYSE